MVNKKVLSSLLSVSILSTALFSCNSIDNINLVDESTNISSINNVKTLSFEERNKIASKKVLVGYKNTLSKSKISEIENKYDLKLLKDLKKIKTAVFESNAGISINTNVISSLKTDKEITYAGQDQAPRFDDGFQPVSVSSNNSSKDPLMKDQWSLSKVEAEKAWSVSKGKGVIIGVVDTGVDLEHPDLKANLLPGYNAEDGGKTPPQDGGSHGTHCAGIAAALSNDVGIVGMAPEAKILPVRAISRGSVAEVVEGIMWATDNGANVISLSLGWDYPSDAIVETVGKALKYGLDKNVVFSCALSNSSTYNPKSVPDNFAGKQGFEGVIGVGNIDLNDRKMGASGEWKSISSPGTNIISTIPGGKWGQKTGTSMATPLVAGVAALIISKNPGIKNTEVRKRIMSTAVDLGTTGFDNDFGAGRVNPFAVLSLR